MSTIELVDPELPEALALWPLLPLTAESLTQRRANALELIGAVPIPTSERPWVEPNGVAVPVGLQGCAAIAQQRLLLAKET